MLPALYFQIVHTKNVCVCARVQGFPDGSAVKNLPAVWETQLPSLGLEDPLEKEVATHSSILVWEIPSGLQSMELQKVRHY